MTLVPGVDPELAAEASLVHAIPVAQFGRLVSVLQAEGVARVLLAGKVTKELLYQDFVPDERLLALLRRVPDRNDDTLLLAVVDELAREGIEVVRQDDYLAHLLAQAGPLAGRSPDPRELADARYGFRRAKEIAGLDLGQTVVVKNLAVLAVEAVEGTDACLRRGGGLGRGGAVAVKVAKPAQDPRFDVPTIGPDTLVSMREAGVACLAVEAGATFVVEQAEVRRLADEAGLAVLGVTA